MIYCRRIYTGINIYQTLERNLVIVLVYYQRLDIMYVPKYLLRTIYFFIFSSHLIYACEIRGQNQNSQHFKKLLKLQEKALQIINFRPPTATTNHLFLENKMLKIVVFIKYICSLFVRSFLTKESVPLFNDAYYNEPQP